MGNGGSQAHHAEHCAWSSHATSGPCGQCRLGECLAPKLSFVCIAMLHRGFITHLTFGLIICTGSARDRQDALYCRSLGALWRRTCYIFAEARRWAVVPRPPGRPISKCKRTIRFPLHDSTNRVYYSGHPAVVLLKDRLVLQYNHAIWLGMCRADCKARANLEPNCRDQRAYATLPAQPRSANNRM